MQRTADGVSPSHQDIPGDSGRKGEKLYRPEKKTTSNVTNQVSVKRHLIVLSVLGSCRMFHTVQVTCVQGSQGSRAFVDSTNRAIWHRHKTTSLYVPYFKKPPFTVLSYLYSDNTMNRDIIVLKVSLCCALHIHYMRPTSYVTDN